MLEFFKNLISKLFAGKSFLTVNINSGDGNVVSGNNNQFIESPELSIEKKF